MEAIGTLAGGIAHDFNNILGIILGYTHELLNTNGDERENRAHSLEVIASSAERGAKIVKQLLTFARKTGVEHNPRRERAHPGDPGSPRESSQNFGFG
jgi:signal transduction histidine kinase